MKYSYAREDMNENSYDILKIVKPVSSKSYKQFVKHDFEETFAHPTTGVESVKQ